MYVVREHAHEGPCSSLALRANVARYRGTNEDTICLWPFRNTRLLNCSVFAAIRILLFSQGT